MGTLFIADFPLCTPGKALRTVVLRPTVMYGELDPYFVTQVFMQAQRRPPMRVGDGQAKNQYTYVGNVAWAHICAMRAPSSADGQVFYITDDTPSMNLFDFLEPFYQSRGYSYSRWRIPFSLVYYLMSFVEMILWLLGPFHEFNLPNTKNSLTFVNCDHSFNRQKAAELLDYQPKYNYEQSSSRSMKYYDTLIPEKGN